MNYISTLIIDSFFLNVVFGDYASTSKGDYFYLVFKTIHTFLILHIQKKKNIQKSETQTPWQNLLSKTMHMEDRNIASRIIKSPMFIRITLDFLVFFITFLVYYFPENIAEKKLSKL